jgi:16S rRNA (guanine966-N2)-methyltransferase
MRIIAGEFRGRRLLTPKNARIRPTSDRVREAIFSIVSPHVPEASVLDLFAGTGALGLEALSRGAARAVFVDQNADAVRLIRSNVVLCAVQQRVRIIQGAVERVIRRLAAGANAFNMIFMDPPYGEGYLEKTLVLLDLVAHPDALVIAEHHVREPSPALCGEWVQAQKRRYGDTAVSFFTKDLTRLE